MDKHTMDKHVARERLAGKAFFEEKHGMLLVRDNDLIELYQQAARRAHRSDSAWKRERPVTLPR